MNDSAERKSGAILSYVSIIINTVIQLLYTPLLIHKLGQSEYGLYSLVASIIGYLTVLDLGFGNAIIVYTAKYRAQKKYEEEKKLHGMFKVIFIIIGVIAAILGLVLYLFTDNIFGSTMTNVELEKMKIMMLILSFNLMITFSFSIYNSIISAYEKFTFQKIMSILSAILKPLLMIPLLFMGYKSIAMSIIITIVNIIILLSNYIYCRNKLKVKTKFLGFDKVLFKTIFGYSIWIFISIIVAKINWSVDNFVLGAVSGTIAVSIYSVASTFNLLFENLSSCCCSVMLPKLSKMVAKNETDAKLNNEFIRFGRIQWYIIFLVLSGFIIFGKQFISIWAGKNFGESYYVALILIVPHSLVLVQNLGVYIMQAKNLHKIKAIITLITSIINIIVSIPLAKYYGGIGAASGTAGSMIICNLIIINIYYYKVVKLNIIDFWINIIKISLPLLFIFLVTLITLNSMIFGTKMMIIYIFIYACIYSIVAYFLSFNKYEKSIINSGIKKISRR